MTKQEFINTIYPYINSVWNIKGFKLPFKSIAIAQAALESGWGTSQLASKYNNYFGIVADSSWKGKTIKFNSNGLTYRAYDNILDSVQDYVRFLNVNQRYNNNRVFDSKSYKEQAKALQTAGYAGNSTTYANSLIQIIESNKLYTYDNSSIVPGDTNTENKTGKIKIIAGIFIIFICVVFLIQKKQ